MPAETITRIDNDHVSVDCTDCKATFRIKFTVGQERAWRNGALIQRVAPELGDRAELLISGTCSTCFDRLFADDADEEEEFVW